MSPVARLRPPPPPLRPSLSRSAGVAAAAAPFAASQSVSGRTRCKRRTCAWASVCGARAGIKNNSNVSW